MFKGDPLKYREKILELIHKFIFNLILLSIFAYVLYFKECISNMCIDNLFKIFKMPIWGLCAQNFYLKMDCTVKKL